MRRDIDDLSLLLTLVVLFAGVLMLVLVPERPAKPAPIVAAGE